MTLFPPQAVCVSSIKLKKWQLKKKAEVWKFLVPLQSENIMVVTLLPFFDGISAVETHSTHIHLRCCSKLRVFTSPSMFITGPLLMAVYSCCRLCAGFYFRLEQYLMQTSLEEIAVFILRGCLMSVGLSGARAKWKSNYSLPGNCACRVCCVLSKKKKKKAKKLSCFE